MDNISYYDGLMVEKKADAELLASLPPLPGTYVLVLRISKRLEISVGKLGNLVVRPGHYLYVGSALGPGGLAARVGRHCQREKTRRWHADYLRCVADLEEVWYAAGKARRECRWARTLSRLPGASVPMRGLGASDCGCPSHLLFFTLPPTVADSRKKLCNQRIERLRLVDG